MKALMVSLMAALLLPTGAFAQNGFKVTMGTEIPLFSLSGPNGTRVAARDGEKALLLVFVEEDGARSRQSLQALKEFVVPRIGDSGIEVAAVVVNPRDPSLRSLATEFEGVPLVADAGGRFFAHFAEAGLPRVVIANGEGKITFLRAGYAPGREAEWLGVARDVAAGKRQPDGSIIAEITHARDIRGQKAPEVPVETWITPAPQDMQGKFVLYDFWATWCGPCIAAMDQAERFHDRFAERLVTIAISDEPAHTVQELVQQRGWKQPIAVDTQGRAKKLLEIRAIPHAFLQAPDGTVVWQGHPVELWSRDGEGMRRLLEGKR